jgi:glucose/arabinose dehydrogenase
MPRATAVRRGLTALTTALALIGGVLISTAASPLATAAAPKVKVTRIVGGLSIPWDLTWVGGLLLFDQRGGGVWSKRGSDVAKKVYMRGMPRVYVHSEGGMLGIVADPKAASNRYFYTCMAVATAAGGPKDVEVWKWKLTSDTRAVKVRTMITGIPLSSDRRISGRHSGCRLRFRSSRRLYVGTGDAVTGTNPQNLHSLGGKVLRVASDGSIPKDNPFYSLGGKARYVVSFGHRNVQGLMTRPGTGQLWSVEHGTDRDDEINRVFWGSNYGWSPTPGYNEARPMTDKTRYPKAVSAKWRSGFPTVATSGGTFISGSRWGSWNGRLAVAMLKGQGILLFTVDSADHVSGKQTLFTSYGRIRTIQQGPDGALYFTTSNGSGDGIYKITVG